MPQAPGPAGGFARPSAAGCARPSTGVPVRPSEAAKNPVPVFSANEDHVAPSVMVWTSDYFGAATGVVQQV